MHVIFSGESAEIHYGNSGNFSKDIFRILRGYSSADFTGIPRDSPLILWEILRIYSGIMQVNFTRENPETHCRNPGS